MELPPHLKTLYRHWPKHIYTTPLREEKLTCNNSLLEDIDAFVLERMRIWERKTLSLEPPFTDDPILREYRFCNIFREFDRQTIIFHELLLPIRDDFPLWLLNMFYFRMVANTATVQHVGPLGFSEHEQKTFFNRINASPRPRYGTPYVFPVSTILKSDTPTREAFIAFHLPSVMRGIADEITSWKNVSVYDGVKKILPLFGFNHEFLWTEVLIDAAYQYPEYINLFGRFPIGPGSLPTMRRLREAGDYSLFVTILASHPLYSGITYEGQPLRLSAENWEGIGCEFRKYTNLKEGNGRKRKYR